MYILYTHVYNVSVSSVGLYGKSRTARVLSCIETVA